MRNDVSECSLDLSRLEKVRHHASGRTLARCPACAIEGGDHSGSHLVIFPDGRFACAAHSGDGAHRRHIFALAGNLPAPPGSPERRTTAFRQSLEWQARQHREEKRQADLRELEERSRTARQSIFATHPWTRADAWHDSPQIPDSLRVRRDPGHFLASLFAPEDLLWTGAVHDSGSPHHARHWRSCSSWQADGHEAGPMTTTAVWQPGAFSRSAPGVRSAPYVVLDFDGMDGIRPQKDQELEEHIHASLACIRWLREDLEWLLGAIVWTGGKSLHAWFHHPPAETLRSLATAADVFGIDPGLLGRPEHPCRLPGQRHDKTGRFSEVLWLQLQK